MANQTYFDDIGVGIELPTIPNPVITRKPVRYARASGDFPKVRYDQEGTARTSWGRIIVHLTFKAGCMARIASTSKRAIATAVSG